MEWAYLAVGMSLGCAVMYGYLRWSRLLRTRKEWYADPVIRDRHGEDTNPDGWDMYG